MQERTAEWLDRNKINADYHTRQFKEPYQSTIAFCDWLEANGFLTHDSQLTVLDVGAGAGANTYYMSKRFPKSSFVGVDFNPDLVDQGNAFLELNKIQNCRMEVGDLYNPDSRWGSIFDGVVSFQTLSWLPEFSLPLKAMAGLSPRWIALTSLFYDGLVSCAIEVTEYHDDLEPHRSSPYNVYSLPIVREFLRGNGYADFLSTPFEIGIDLPKPSRSLMTTYTETLKDGRRLQVSGPLLMPWHFIAARR